MEALQFQYISFAWPNPLNPTKWPPQGGLGPPDQSFGGGEIIKGGGLGAQKCQNPFDRMAIHKIFLRPLARPVN